MNVYILAVLIWQSAAVVDCSGHESYCPRPHDSDETSLVQIQTRVSTGKQRPEKEKLRGTAELDERLDRGFEEGMMHTMTKMDHSTRVSAGHQRPGNGKLDDTADLDERSDHGFEEGMMKTMTKVDRSTMKHADLDARLDHSFEEGMIKTMTKVDVDLTTRPPVAGAGNQNPLLRAWDALKGQCKGLVCSGPSIERIWSDGLGFGKVYWADMKQLYTQWKKNAKEMTTETKKVMSGWGDNPFGVNVNIGHVL